MEKDDEAYLASFFSDLINYNDDDPLQPIDVIRYLSPEGDNCLHIAAIRGDIRAVTLLIEAGLDVNSCGDMGNTPLHYASNEGHQDIIKFLISKGANPDSLNEFGNKTVT